ncbi:MAG TPA: hypothetical protein PKD64_03585 [Pirellulaceae bacterium]|nr:hypothetical protein [Pirellulaceae bacterium]HMO91253.1 hypothetical protein [Pirellulaceae bacterium]HMP68563.1 hypothetical protein [Pirellulaceae bacterium]
MNALLWIASIAAHVAASIALSRTLGVFEGLLVYVVATSLLTGFAGWLLRDATLGVVTWRNRTAGFLLPWTSIVGGGRLHALVLKNVFASIIAGLVAVLCDQSRLLYAFGLIPAAAHGEQTPWGVVALSWLTVACWLVVFAAWLWIIRSLLLRRSDIVSVLTLKRGGWVPLIMPPIALGMSVYQKLTGHAWSALLWVGIPLLIVLCPVMLMAGVILYHQFTGKPMRWN